MKKNLRLQIADRIREILTEKGLKQQELADRADMTKSYLSRILSGSINLTVDTLKSLKNLNYSMYEMIVYSYVSGQEPFEKFLGSSKGINYKILRN